MDLNLSEKQINEIAEKAAQIAIREISNMAYENVGRAVIQKLLWIVGALFTGLALWLQSKDFLKL